MGNMRSGSSREKLGFVVVAAAISFLTPGCDDGDSPVGGNDARPPSDVAPERADAARSDTGPTDPDASAPGPDGATTGQDAGSAGPDMSDARPDTDSGSSSPAGLGPWTGNDNVAPSKNPPGGLRTDQVPMFVALGFDDNPTAEAIDWVVATLSALKNPPGTGKAATHDGTPPRATFYNTSAWGSPEAQAAWKAAHAAGFELANHTVNHLHGAGGPGGMNFSAAGWRTEIQGCTDVLASPAVGARRDQINGFRSPFGQYNGALFPVLKELGFWYDCSIDEGQQADQDGTNYFWPYTLDNGSPGHTARTDLPAIQSWPKGLWEMPIYALLAPPDSEAQKYGFAPGLRTKIGNNGKITGMDWNLWFGIGVTGPEFTAVLKYTLDQRRKGNRAPLLIGMHSNIYAANGNEVPPMAPTAQARAAVTNFLTYALGFPEVRIVPTRAVLDWIRNPVPLD